MNLFNYTCKKLELKTEDILNIEQQEIWTIIQKINQSWKIGNFSDFDKYFHENIVFNSPDFRNEINGKIACVQTYQNFADNSEVLMYEENNPKIVITENTAIATYEFEMRYKQNGKIYHETGIDILVLSKAENIWKVIWRGMSNLNSI